MFFIIILHSEIKPSIHMTSTGYQAILQDPSLLEKWIRNDSCSYKLFFTFHFVNGAN